MLSYVLTEGAKMDLVITLGVYLPCKLDLWASISVLQHRTQSASIYPVQICEERQFSSTSSSDFFM